MRQIAPTRNDKDEWSRILRAYPWRGGQGFGTEMDEPLAMDGAMTGEIDAQTSDLIALSMRSPESVGPDSDLVGLAEASEQINLVLRVFKLRLGFLRGSAWLMTAMFTYDDHDDVFRFGYLAGRRLPDLFRKLDAMREKGGGYFLTPPEALANI